MAEKRQLTRVVFRRFKEGETIALFPYMPGNAHGNAVTSYMHTGQHAAADYAGVIAVTRPAAAVAPEDTPNASARGSATAQTVRPAMMSFISLAVL